MDDNSIKVKIDQLGEVEVEAIGFHGQGCADATKAIEDALASGQGGVSVVHKPEWHETEDDNIVHETHVGG